MSIHVLKVDEANHKVRLDVFLTNNLADVPSRSFVKRLIETNGVFVNGEVVKVHHKVLKGDEIKVDFSVPEDELEHIEAENIPLNIFYEDEHLLVVNKPVGMLVHPARGCATGTLVNALLYHYKTLSDVNTNLRPGIVHRLDQATSGLLLVAKNNIAHTKLAKQFKKHKVFKQYVALVEGLIEFDEGKIDVPLGRHPLHREKKSVQFDDSAKESLTYYKVLKRSKGVTLVALFPKTGRMHQLRVHMSYLGHPILGDEKYGKKNNFFRLALHAKAIGFTHPETKQFVKFSTPTPSEFLERVR